MTSPSNTDPPTLHEVDERWTIPWAVVSEDARPIAADAELTWHGLDATVELAGHTISRPMLYTSKGRTADGETSCIDTTLPVGAVDWEGAEPLAHWTSYAALSPTQRANYITWLASGRSLPLTDMNYAFLYFYGLERYALIEKGDPEDVLRVLMRLLKHYEEAPSFFSSASRLAAFLFATKGIEKLKPAWFQRLFMQRRIPLHADALSVATTWLYERKKPLPPELAYEIAQQDIRCSAPASSDAAAFEARFVAAYAAKFGEGMMLVAAETEQTWKYRPINPSLQSWEHFASLWSVTSADVMGAYDQFQPLIACWRDCAAKGVEGGWASLIDGHANAQGRVLVPIQSVAQCADVSLSPKKDLTLGDSLEVVARARAAGYELLPNPSVLLRPYKARERVVLIRAEAGHLESDPYYLAGTLLLALGTAIAEVDGEVDHVEVLHVSEIVNSLYHFNDHDKKRLGVLRRRLIKFPPKLNSLIRRVRVLLTDEERGEVGKYLVGVAGANFHFCEKERHALRRAYRAFGLAVAELDGLLETLLVPETGEVNRSALAQHMRETKAFAARLGVAMQAVVPLEGDEAGKRGIWYGRTPVAALEQAVGSNSVADPYCDALYALVQRGDWSDAEFVALGKAHGVYLEGAVDGLGDWEDVGEAEGGQRYVFSEDDGELSDE